MMMKFYRLVLREVLFIIKPVLLNIFCNSFKCVGTILYQASVLFCFCDLPSFLLKCYLRTIILSNFLRLRLSCLHFLHNFWPGCSPSLHFSHSIRFCPGRSISKLSFRPRRSLPSVSFRPRRSLLSFCLCPRLSLLSFLYFRLRFGQRLLVRFEHLLNLSHCHFCSFLSTSLGF